MTTGKAPYSYGRGTVYLYELDVKSYELGNMLPIFINARSTKRHFNEDCAKIYSD